MAKKEKKKLQKIRKISLQMVAWKSLWFESQFSWTMAVMTFMTYFCITLLSFEIHLKRLGRSSWSVHSCCDPSKAVSTPLNPRTKKNPLGNKHLSLFAAADLFRNKNWINKVWNGCEKNLSLKMSVAFFGNFDQLWDVVELTLLKAQALLAPRRSLDTGEIQP